MGHTARILRQQMDLSLREVSHRSGISLAHLSEFERGQNEISSELLSALSTGLQVKQSDIILEAYKLIVREEQREAKGASRGSH